MLQRGGVQLLQVRYQLPELSRIDVTLIKKLLRRDTEIFTDIEQTLQRRQSFPVFDLVDVAVVLSQRQRHIAGGDILRLETVEPYPAEYRATTERAKKEREANARPPLKTALPDLSAYGTIVLAHPIWGGHMPMPVRTFLDAVDLSGKRVAHVTTHGGSGLGQSHGELAQIEPKAVLLDPHDVYGWQGVRDLESVGVWLRRIGLVE